MARPFTYISSTTYYELETYLFKLTLFTDSPEYFELSITNKNKIDREILLMGQLLDTMQMFRQIPSNEKAVLAIQVTPLYTAEYVRLFRFSSPIVASLCLGISNSHIVEVCKGRRRTAGGYKFSYEDSENQVVQPKRNTWYNI